ncbi:MAG: Arc family DNA binding domain-containing protein [Saprospiraceae bacterium]
MPKKSFALRIDEKTMKAVEKWAADEFRSVNGQLEWMITKMLRESNRLKVEKETLDSSNAKESPKS